MTVQPMLALVRFEGVEHPWLWLLLVIAAAAILYAAYRGMFQRTSQHLAWWLMGLRAVGLVLLLLALAKPTWTRESEQVDAGRVAVIVDTSRSMSKRSTTRRGPRRDTRPCRSCSSPCFARL